MGHDALIARARGRGAALGPLVALVAACAAPRISLPGVAAPPPVPHPSGGLRAGVGRADITPPPGLGLVGTGMEGRRANGYRTRLYARALVLENGAGERFAIVATDLGLLSAQLQRRAVWIVDSLRGPWLGTDRLIVTGTHTHSGPGNFLDAAAYNLMGSTVMGYDSAFADSLARGVARALIHAIDDLQPAVAAWGSDTLWRFTRNRSIESYDSNPTPDRPSFAPPNLPTPEDSAVNPTWLMLRVDYGIATAHRPAAAFSVFAMHGTANSDLDNLYDGDLHGQLERGLERWMDVHAAGTGADQSPVPRTVHLLSNGTEGDVSPDWPEASRCPLPKLVPIGWRPGPRGNHPTAEWLEIRKADADACIRESRGFVGRQAAAMTDRIVALYGSLETRLSSDLPIAVAFGVLPLEGSLAPLALCDPAIGLSALGGAPDARTRLYNWRFLGFGSPINDGPGAPRHAPDKCQGWKYVPLRAIQFFLAHLGALPDFAQFTVARIGNTVLATAPAELTTVAGERIRRQVSDRLHPLGSAIAQVAIVGLTDGHLSYVATEREYTRQRFEGANTFFGPKTDSVFAAYVGSLAARLAAGGEPGVTPIPDLHVSPGKPATIVPRHTAARGPSVSRRIERVRCSNGSLEITWVDERPEDVLPHDGPIVRVERRLDGAWGLVTWDDDPWLEVVPPAHGHAWHLKWTPQSVPEGQLRVRLEPRPGEGATPITAAVPAGCFAPASGH